MSTDRPGDEAALRLARLPPGRHGSAARIRHPEPARSPRRRDGRGRRRSGLNDATITQICAAAGVSRRTFYTYFSSKEACFFAAYETIAEHLRVATTGRRRRGRVARQVVAKLGAALEFLAANPDLARFFLIAPQRAGEEVASRYREGMDRAVEYLCEGMPPAPATKTPSEAVAGSLIGGMVALVVRKVEAGEGDDLPRLLPDLVELFLAPYLGRTEAVQVAQGRLEP